MRHVINALLADVGLSANFTEGLVRAYNPEQPRDEIGRWTDGGGSVESAITSLRSGAPKGQLLMPSELEDAPTLEDTDDDLDDEYEALHLEIIEDPEELKQLQSKMKPKTMSVSRLQATQPTVSEEVVRGYIKRPSDKLPDVIRKGGTNWIIDGHHRIVAEILQGRTSVRVNFVDADVP